MANLKIKDIETLERLSLEELNQVVGGMDCPGRRRRRRRRKLVDNGDITAQDALGNDIIVSELLIDNPPTGLT